MFSSKFLFIVFCLNCCFLNSVKCSDDSGSDGDEKAKEESKEMEAFMKLMIKSSQKNLKRLLETTDIGSVTSSKCNASWHQFMSENQLTPERFSTIMEEYKSGNHDKIVKLVRPEQCLLSDNGQFCQVDHLTNMTMRNKPRVFDLTYALCYPRGCSNTELNDILSALTDNYKASMIQVKLNVVKCTTSMESVTKMEIDTAQKMMSKMSAGNNQTFEVPKFKLPDSYATQPGPSSISVPSSVPSYVPNLPVNMPDDLPMFSFEDLGIPRHFQPAESSAQPPPPSVTHYASLPVIPTPNLQQNQRPETTSAIVSSSSPTSTTSYPTFKWSESKPDEALALNPLRYPEVYYSDELSESFKSPPLMTSTTPSPLDKTRLLKMIPGLIVPDEDD